ncbi:MAG: response regulator [Bacteroidales bacterium]|nr:response regulator [Bacteroidales bacterium]
MGNTLTYEDIEQKIKELEYKNKILSSKNTLYEKLEQAEKTIKEVEDSNKLKTSFLINMSHEIRTPLNSIIGFSNLLAGPDLTLSQKNEYINYIISNSNTLLHLLDDIINISRIEAGQLTIDKTECYINGLLGEIFTNFSKISKNKKNIELKLNPFLKVQDFSIFSDPVRIKQIFTNLLDNAFKYTKSGYIEFGYTIKDKETIRFFVKDTGVGIPKDKFEIIFEMFKQANYSATKEYDGSGLGLAISKKLVELLDGKIWVESIVDKGSTFYFTLPWKSYEVSEKEIAASNNIEKIYNWKDKKILIAEDIDSNYRFVEATLRHTKVNLLRANDGKQAVRICKLVDDIDLILMDIRMPIMNGYDAIYLIKKINKDIPIIALTAYANQGEKEKSLNAGCIGYIQKPIKPKLLLSILNNYLV